jgi:hypothetical protein
MSMENLAFSEEEKKLSNENDLDNNSIPNPPPFPTPPPSRPLDGGGGGDSGEGSGASENAKKRYKFKFNFFGINFSKQIEEASAKFLPYSSSTPISSKDTKENNEIDKTSNTTPSTTTMFDSLIKQIKKLRKSSTDDDDGDSTQPKQNEEQIKVDDKNENNVSNTEPTNSDNNNKKSVTSSLIQTEAKSLNETSENETKSKYRLNSDPVASARILARAIGQSAVNSDFHFVDEDTNRNDESELNNYFTLDNNNQGGYQYRQMYNLPPRQNSQFNSYNNNTNYNNGKNRIFVV